MGECQVGFRKGERSAGTQYQLITCESRNHTLHEAKASMTKEVLCSRRCFEVRVKERCFDGKVGRLARRFY